MKARILVCLPLVSALALPFTGCTTGAPDAATAARMSHDGLVLKENSKYADLVYVRPGVDLAGYSKVMLLEPEIAFRKNWLTDYNMDHPMQSISDRDVGKIMAVGRRLFVEEFRKELLKGGFEVVSEPGEDVLLVKPALVDLYIAAPDPSNQAGIWTKVYTESFGDMTLYLELYDSVTHEILVRALDEKRDIGEGAGSWRFARNRATNIADASMAFSEWASMFVMGLKRAEEASKSAAPAE